MMDEYLKTAINNILFIVIIVWIVYKAVIIINEMVYNRLKIQAFKSQDRELRAYEKLENISVKLSKAYEIIDKYFDKKEESYLDINEKKEIIEKEESKIKNANIVSESKIFNMVTDELVNNVKSGVDSVKTMLNNIPTSSQAPTQEPIQPQTV